MIPILYSPDNLTGSGLGLFTEAMSCSVHEVINGEYELTITYPLSGHLYSYLLDDPYDYVIKAKVCDTLDPQLFTIYKIVNNMNGTITINAQHISYKLSYEPVSFITAKTMSPSGALTEIKNNIIGDTNGFRFDTDLTKDNIFGVSKPVSVRAVLGGGDDSFINVFGGEILWDNYSVHVKQHRGKNTGVTIAYGKNLVDLEQEKNISDMYTGAVGYYSEGTRNVVGSIEYISGSKFGKKPYIYDCTSDFNATKHDVYFWGGNPYTDKDHTEQVSPLQDNHYYYDKETCITVYAHLGKLYTDSKHKNPLSPEINKYYIDNDTAINAYYKDGKLYKDANAKTELMLMNHKYYIDQTEVGKDAEGNSIQNDSVYTLEGSTLKKVASNSEIYRKVKAVYNYTPDGISYVKDTMDERDDPDLKDYLYQYQPDGCFIGHPAEIPEVTDVSRMTRQYIASHNFGVPSVSMRIKYEDLSKYDEYKQLASMESVSLGDFVTVIFSKLKVNVEAEITETTYDVLKEEYSEIVLGDKTVDISDIITKRNQYNNAQMTKMQQEFQDQLRDMNVNMNSLMSSQSANLSNKIDIAQMNLTADYTKINESTSYELKQLDLDMNNKVDQVVYDMTKQILDVNTDINTINGDINNLTGNVSQLEILTDEQAQNLKSAVNDLKKVINESTAKIVGGLGGYVKINSSEAVTDGHPDEILIMDQPDITTAKNIIRMNKNGIGFSRNGYAGPFNSAWTIDGMFDAKNITTGILTSITIQTAGQNARATMEAGFAALKGYWGQSMINVIDLVNGTGTGAGMVIDAKNSLAIRTPKITIADKSAGTGSLVTTNTASESFDTVTSVGKYMAPEREDIWEIEVGGHLVTLPVILKVYSRTNKTINGLSVGSTSTRTYDV